MMCLARLHVGGLVAMGFDPSGRYLLTVSHSGRGVFETGTWRRVARDGEPTYPAGGRVPGIGPLAGQTLSVEELDYESGTLTVPGPAGAYSLTYREGVITVTPSGG